MAKHNEITDREQLFHNLKGHVECTLATDAQNLSYSLKEKQFAALTVSELVSQYSGYKPNNVYPTMCEAA